jgi:hypothetical protein
LSSAAAGAANDNVMALATNSLRMLALACLQDIRRLLDASMAGFASDNVPALI